MLRGKIRNWRLIESDTMALRDTEIQLLLLSRMVRPAGCTHPARSHSVVHTCRSRAPSQEGLLSRMNLRIAWDHWRSSRVDIAAEAIVPALPRAPSAMTPFAQRTRNFRVSEESAASINAWRLQQEDERVTAMARKAIILHNIERKFVAAVAIQRVWRGFDARRTGSGWAVYLRRKQSAIALQRLVRGRIVRRRVISRLRLREAMELRRARWRVETACLRACRCRRRADQRACRRRLVSWCNISVGHFFTHWKEWFAVCVEDMDKAWVSFRCWLTQATAWGHTLADRQEHRHEAEKARLALLLPFLEQGMSVRLVLPEHALQGCTGELVHRTKQFRFGGHASVFMDDDQSWHTFPLTFGGTNDADARDTLVPHPAPSLWGEVAVSEDVREVLLAVAEAVGPEEKRRTAAIRIQRSVRGWLARIHARMLRQERTDAMNRRLGS